MRRDDSLGVLLRASHALGDESDEHDATLHTLDATRVFFKPICDAHVGSQVLVFNYAGQAGTKFAVPSAAEAHAAAGASGASPSKSAAGMGIFGASGSGVDGPLTAEALGRGPVYYKLNEKPGVGSRRVGVRGRVQLSFQEDTFNAREAARAATRDVRSTKKPCISSTMTILAPIALLGREYYAYH